MKDAQKIKLQNKKENRKQMLQDMFEARIQVKWQKNNMNDREQPANELFIG